MPRDGGGFDKNETSAMMALISGWILGAEMRSVGDVRSRPQWIPRGIDLLRRGCVEHHLDHAHDGVIHILHVGLSGDDLATIPLPQGDVVVAAITPAGPYLHVPAIADDAVDDVATIDRSKVILGAEAVAQFLQLLCRSARLVDAIASGHGVGVGGVFEHSALPSAVGLLLPVNAAVD